MSTVYPAYKNADAYGRPVFESMDDYANNFLLAGSEPGMQVATAILLADSQDLAQFTVVGINTAGKLAKATYNATEATAIKAVGVLAHAASSGASNTTKYAQVFLTGVFNIDAQSPLVWDASFDTEAKKLAWHQGNPNLIFRRRTPAA